MFGQTDPGENAARRGDRPAGEGSGPPSEPPPVRVYGTVARVTYSSEESLYTVIKVEPEQGYGDPESLFGWLVTAVGNAPAPAPGLRVRLSGHWGNHPAHGRQFEFDELVVQPPADNDGLVRYLSSKAFEGIGPKLAERIVKKLGHETLDAIQENPACLDGIRGLRPDVAVHLAETIRAQLGTHQLHSFLTGLGLGPHQRVEVVRALGTDCEAKLRANPYLLAESVSGFGFATADRVAQNLGHGADSPMRLRSALWHVLRSAGREGHSLLPRARLVAGARELLGEDATPADLERHLEDLDREGAVHLERELREGEELVYLPMLYTSETRLAENLSRLAALGETRPMATALQLERAEERARIDLHPLQREAVLGLLEHPVGLLTGGPGVGKTTIVRLVVELANAAGARVALASPTGRAAKRLSEATQREASTVHRLLGWDPQRGSFAHHDGKPLDTDILIVDELSMLDVTLAHHLVKALKAPTRLILVGDPDQLPSVQAGNVLADLLASGVIPVWRLTQIFRQSEDSLIVSNAHRILRGELPEFPAPGDPQVTGGDFFLFPAEDEHACADRLIDVVTQRIPARFGLDWSVDVQVLAPMYKGACGVDELNARLREALGMGGRELEYKGRVWRTGDRVIHVRNDYEKQIFNGDLGRVTRVLKDGEGLLVRYPEQEIFYSPDELKDLQPAFAITVHRSQGGEFPCVVMPLTTRHYVMLQRHLLYTAVTRARQLVVLVGSRRALQMAVDNAEQGKRESALAERLRARPPSERQRECQDD